MRLFVALEIPATTRDALAALTARLAPACRGARWSRPEGMHLTLTFIGEVAAGQAARIREELLAVCGLAALEVAFRGVGFFPNQRHPRVFWSGVEFGPGLAQLAAQVENRLEPLGISRETREFRPHLTLARFNSEDGLPALHAAIEKSGPFEFGRATFEEFHLIESTLRPQGPQYTTLESFRFTASAGAGRTAGGARA
jgi:2'-5' RNA ligase